MISKNDIYVGARIINIDPEHPQTMKFKGTVQSITSIGEGEFYYTVAVLPDEEFRLLPGIIDNCYFGLTYCFAHQIVLLPDEEVVQEATHTMLQYRINIQLLNNNMEAFYNELIPMLMAYGYNITPNREPYAAPEARKGKKRIYCHPMQLAGECPPAEFDQIEQMLHHGKTYKICNKSLEEMFDYTEEEELEQYHLKYDDNIQTMLLDAFRTENHNVYKNKNQIIETISKKIKIVTITNYICSGSGTPSTEYVKAAYNALVQDGKISIHPDFAFQNRTKEDI